MAAYHDQPAPRSADSTTTLTGTEYRDLVQRRAAALHVSGCRRGDTIWLSNRPEFHVADVAAAHLGVASSRSIPRTPPSRPPMSSRRRGASARDRVGIPGEGAVRRNMPAPSNRAGQPQPPESRDDSSPREPHRLRALKQAHGCLAVGEIVGCGLSGDGPTRVSLVGGAFWVLGRRAWSSLTSTGPGCWVADAEPVGRLGVSAGLDGVSYLPRGGLLDGK